MTEGCGMAKRKEGGAQGEEFVGEPSEVLARTVGEKIVKNNEERRVKMGKRGMKGAIRVCLCAHMLLSLANTVDFCSY